MHLCIILQLGPFSITQNTRIGKFLGLCYIVRLKISQLGFGEEKGFWIIVLELFRNCMAFFPPSLLLSIDSMCSTWIWEWVQCSLKSFSCLGIYTVWANRMWQGVWTTKFQMWYCLQSTVKSRVRSPMLCISVFKIVNREIHNQATNTLWT